MQTKGGLSLEKNSIEDIQIEKLTQLILNIKKNVQYIANMN